MSKTKAEKVRKSQQAKVDAKEAARRQVQEESLILEIEESLKQERIEKIWKEYGPYILAAACLVVLATAAVTGWQGYRSKVNAEKTEILLTAIDAEDQARALAEALPRLEGGSKFVALFTNAGLMIENGDAQAALELYKNGAKDESLPKVFRDLAAYMAVKLEWATSETPDSDALLAQLAPLWQDEAGPWRWHARLQAAMILAHDKQQYLEARKHLTQVMLQEGVPPSLAERARSLDHIYYLRQQMMQNNAPQDADKGEDQQG